MDEAEAAGSDLARVATIYDINLQSVKKMTSADLVVAVSATADGKIVLKKTDPNQTHPYSMSELLTKVNQRRQGRNLTSYDHQVICWKEDLRNNVKHAWKHSNGGAHVWSGDAVNYFRSLTDEYLDMVREEYQAHMRGRRS